MSYLYGDSTPSPLKSNFIEFLGEALDFSVHTLQSANRLQLLAKRIVATKEEADAEITRLEALHVSVATAMERTPKGAGLARVHLRQGDPRERDGARAEGSGAGEGQAGARPRRPRSAGRAGARSRRAGAGSAAPVARSPRGQGDRSSRPEGGALRRDALETLVAGWKPPGASCRSRCAAPVQPGRAGRSVHVAARDPGPGVRGLGEKGDQAPAAAAREVLPLRNDVRRAAFRQLRAGSEQSVKARFDVEIRRAGAARSDRPRR